MENRKVLEYAIEETRARLDHAIEQSWNIAECYEISLELDELLERYILLYQERVPSKLHKISV